MWITKFHFSYFYKHVATTNFISFYLFFFATTNFKSHVMAHSMFPLHSTGLDYESYSGAWREENEFSIYYFYSFYSY